MSQPTPPPGVLRGRFRCRVINPGTHKDEVILQAITADEDDPDRVNDYAEATPYGELRIGVADEDVRGYFEPGEEYYLDISKADPDE